MLEADKKKKKLSPEDQVCVLISGGLDSCVLAAELSHHYLMLFPVYVKGGPSGNRSNCSGSRNSCRALEQKRFNP